MLDSQSDTEEVMLQLKVGDSIGINRFSLEQYKGSITEVVSSTKCRIKWIIHPHNNQPEFLYDKTLIGNLQDSGKSFYLCTPRSKEKRILAKIKQLDNRFKARQIAKGN